MGKGKWYGVKGLFDYLETKRYKSHVRIFLSRFRAYLTCPECRGTRFRKDALDYYLDGCNIGQVGALSLKDALGFVRGFGKDRVDPAGLLLQGELERRLSYLNSAGLGYLSLDRQSRTLSGGEVARAMLTRALASSLVETLYILDEPSRGLHARDSSRVAGILRRLSSQRNTVCVVEHDPEIILSSDFVVDLGPGPGEKGGELLYAGASARVSGVESSTGDAMIRLGEAKAIKGVTRGAFDTFLEALGAGENNLKAIDVRIPKGALTVITGVSGSGKSTLLEQILYRGALREKGLPAERPGRYESFRGLETIREIVLVDQTPVGRTPRAIVASYLQLYSRIRDIVADAPDARERGFKASVFSFNTAGGRCETCKGQGFETIEMQFLSDIRLPCPSCGGMRFRPEVLQVRYRSRNISEILDMTLSEASSFFEGHEGLREALSGPLEVGLGYLRLGQGVHTLSGGEAQRLKLAHFLFTRPKFNSLILIDEPTVGLHMKDVGELNQALAGLTRSGNTVVIVEHNFEILRQADWVIDLGPEGGEGGGELLYQGPLGGLLASERSVTAACFRDYLEGKTPGLSNVRSGGTDKAPEGIRIIGARHHNLKHLNLDIPRERLVVVTGLSGSGKSTLVFDIVFAEGQRRYVESLSTYVRQFLRLYERPEVDLVLGLPPTVAIEQRTSQAGPKSTVATLTEIYPYLRLLYAKVSDAHCPSCGRVLSPMDPEEMVARVVTAFRNQNVLVLATKVRRRKGHHRAVFEAALKKGFERARVDGELRSFPPIPRLSRYQEHTIGFVVGEVRASAMNAHVVQGLLERAFLEGQEEAEVLCGERRIFLSKRFFCAECGVGLPVPDPLLFSFNTQAGACLGCDGMGRKGEASCPQCSGTRLRKEALAYRVGGRDIASLCALPASEVLGFLAGLRFEGRRATIGRPILSEALARLGFLNELGLGYLDLNRSGETLSGGEGQRIRLATAMGSNLAGICYVLDEPTIGLHPRDNGLLVRALQRVRDRGNSVLVVEHDEETLRAADWVIDLGPGGGEKGGEVVFQGPPAKLAALPGSQTALMLKEASRYRITARDRAGEAPGWLSIEGAKARNLKETDAKIPLGTLVCITGVSGSGKSTLLMEVLYPSLVEFFKGNGRSCVACKALRGVETLRRVLVVDHSPIGRTPRSTPATYIGMMDDIRRLMAQLPESRARGWSPGRFSFNVAGGRCKECGGQGTLRVEMRFLPEVYVSCETCGGRRYNEETLAVKYRGKDMSELLDMTFSEAAVFFEPVSSLRHAAGVVSDLGLGYLSLGQPSPSLSGGEAQRIKLAEEFVKSSNGGTLYLLDEPTTGLHMADIRKLLDLFHRLVERGDTIVVIEHNLDVVKEADWVIDLGPEGGDGGGRVVFQGPVRELIKSRQSHTGRYLRNFLDRT
jgi:excinuclease ABC subunit A